MPANYTFRNTSGRTMTIRAGSYSEAERTATDAFKGEAVFVHRPRRLSPLMAQVYASLFCAVLIVGMAIVFYLNALHAQ